MTEPLIDLGVLAPLDTTPAPAARERYRPAGHGGRHWPVAAAILVVVSAVVVGSRPVPTLEPIASLPAGVLYLSADAENMYVVRPDGVATSELTAYDWRDGSVHWQRPLTGRRNGLYVAAGRPFLLNQPCGGIEGGTIERLDTATGHRRWIRSGSPTTVLAPRPAPDADTATAKERKVKGDAAPTVGPPRLLVADLPAPDCRASYEPGEDPDPVALSAVDTDTGVPQWTVHMRPGERLAVPEGGAATWFATWDTSGLVQVRDGATGLATASARLATIAPTAPQQAVRVVGDLLLVTRQQVTGALFSAYQHDNLRPVWRRDLGAVEPVTLAQLAFGPSVVTCGPMICVPTPTDVTVLDPATGDTMWRRELLVDTETGTELLIARDRSDFGHARAIGWRTGRDVLDLPGWQPIPTVAVDPGVGLIQRVDGDVAHVATLDLRTGELRSLGAATPVPSRCAMIGRRLGCIAGNSDTISLWRVPG